MSGTEQQPQPQPLAGGVEPCPQCGALLAADQRYCLNCGRRRGEPRIDYRRQRPTAGQNGHAPVEAAAAPAPDQRKQRDYTPLAAAGGIAILGLMLLVGVLIGRGNGDSSAPTQPTQVVVPQPESSGSSSGPEEVTGALGTKGKPSKKQKSAKKTAKNVAPPAAITASKDELKALEEKSGEGNYSEESAKLPDEIATPGAAPPEDNKAPGGGSSGTTIE